MTASNTPENVAALEVKVETKSLLHSMALANGVVEKRNVSPILGHVKLSTSGNTLKILATDMDLSLSQSIGAEVMSEGETTVSAQMLAEVTRKISDSEIKLKFNPAQQHLEVIGEGCHFKLSTLPAEQFPSMEYFNEGEVVAIDNKLLLQMLDVTKIAMSNEETRYNMNGVFFHSGVFEANGSSVQYLCAAATDGHRLSAISSGTSVDTKFGIILPKKTVIELSKLMRDLKASDVNVKLHIAHNKVKLGFANMMLISKIVDATFPEYSSFIPKVTSNKLTINRNHFAHAIDRIATVTVDKFRAIKLNLSSNQIELSAFGESKGVAREILPFSTADENYCAFEGDEVIIGFNPKYLLDALQAISDPKVEIYFTDNISPALIKVPGNTGLCFVIMPVQV